MRNKQSCSQLYCDTTTADIICTLLYEIQHGLQAASTRNRISCASDSKSGTRHGEDGGLVSDTAKERYLQLLRQSVQRRLKHQRKCSSRLGSSLGQRKAHQHVGSGDGATGIPESRGGADSALAAAQSPVLRVLQAAETAYNNNPAPPACANEIFDAYIEKVQSFAVVHSARQSKSTPPRPSLQYHCLTHPYSC